MARQARGGLEKRDARTGVLLLTPTLIIVLAVVIVPLLWSFLIAFQELRLLQIGTASIFQPLTLDNFRLVLSSGVMWSSLLLTIFYTAGSTILTIALGLLAALVVRSPFRGRTFVRAAMLLPYVAPVVAVTFVWRTMLNPNFGIVNGFGQNVLGWDEPIAFLSQAQGQLDIFGLSITVPTALLTVILFEGWRNFPFAFLFILARLQSLSREIDEAAVVDGATPLQAFRWVTLPQLMPVIGVLAVLRAIWTFNEFDDVFLLTGGAAGTRVVSVSVFQYLTVQRNVGAGAAQSVVLAVVLVIGLSLYMWLLRRRGERL
ncbi:carbohydrate ABC transporter permease [Georgenia sp. AZ-5]|uniref:carbohydrate ABC transporter permease n=1 Tax=Georgenia sp. AZ-5 TaxID=3367526 RepID=UPI003754A16B